MKVILAAIAEHAWVEKGCLSICKTFDSLNIPVFPYNLPRFSIALTLLVNKEESGEHRLNISLSDPDGKKVINANLNINILPPDESIPETTFSFALNGQNVNFPGPGDYSVNIIINGQIETSIPLYVREKRGPDRI